jgi:hypothetical protein
MIARPAEFACAVKGDSYPVFHASRRSDPAGTLRAETASRTETVPRAETAFMSRTAFTSRMALRAETIEQH